MTTKRTTTARRSAVDDIHNRDLTTRSYNLRASTYDRKTRSVEAVLATENMVRVLDLATWDVIDEILRMDGFQPPPSGQVPLLDTHDRTTIFKQLGSTREMHVEAKTLIGRRYFDSTDEGRKAETKVAEGHVTDGSIGYRVTSSVTIEAGQTAEVAGVTYTANSDRSLRVALAWEIKEDSLCPIGADAAAKNRSEEPQPNRKDQPMNFDKWLQARGLKPDRLTKAQTTSLRADYDAWVKRQDEPAKPADTPAEPQTPADTPAEPDTPADTPAETETPAESEAPADGQRSAIDLQVAADKAIATATAQARATELARRKEITELAELAGVTDTVRAEALDQNMAPAAAREHFVAAVREGRPIVSHAPATLTRGHSSIDALAAGLLIRSAIYDDDQAFVRDVGEQAANDGATFRDTAMIDVCRAAIALDGGTPPAGRDETIRAAFSTASLPIILGNTARLSLLRGYTSVKDTWSPWCVIGSVTNFQTVTRARLTGSGTLEEVSNNGEVAYGTYGEEAEQFNISSYSENTAFTRKNIVNDDLNVLTKQQVRNGRKARLTIAKLVYVHLLANGNMGDGTALFASGHANLAGSKALSSANFGNAIQLFRQQTDLSGEPIDIDPAFLLVPPELEETARVILESDHLIDGSSTAKQGRKNVWKGLVDPLIETRLSNSNYTGYSTTAWYVVGNPADADTIEVAFLNGNQNPIHETFNPGPDRQGIVFRVTQDVGVKSLDWRTVVKHHND